MNQNETNMRTLCVRIQEDLFNKLRELAFKRFKRFHGAIATAVREALQEYINKHGAEEKR